MKKWFITGGLGFIGLNLLETLLKDENNLIKIVDLEKNFKYLECKKKFSFLNKNLKRVKFRNFDICNYKKLKSESKNFDIIIHLAANTGVPNSIKNPIDDMYNNILGSLNVIESAKINKIKKIIIASSSAVVGETLGSINENTIPIPSNPYGVSKLSVENYSRVLGKLYKIKIINLRFSNVYGPYSFYKNSVISKFIKDSITKNRIIINGNGEQTRDFIYVEDLVYAIIKSSKDSSKINKFQISTGIETKIDKLAKIVKLKLDKQLNTDIKIKYTKKLPGDIKRSFANNSLAKKIIKWTPIVNLDYGLNKTIDYFLNMNKKIQ